MDITSLVNDVPEYSYFLTVDELRARVHRLAQEYPSQVDIRVIGQSQNGEEIESVTVGCGSIQAVLFGFPHPNEPIGGLTLDYLTRRLVEDAGLRNYLNVTWHLIPCVDPDGARLNEGWFHGPFHVETYLHHFFRPPIPLQVDSTFPVTYKALHFDNPIPETQALMDLIDSERPHYITGLHNAGFGGVHFYLAEPYPPLYQPLQHLVRREGLPLHHGEPEEPFVKVLAPGIHLTYDARDEYDYFIEYADEASLEALNFGTTSRHYASRYRDTFSLECEIPYFYHPNIDDRSLSDSSRGDVMQWAFTWNQDLYTIIKHQYYSVAGRLRQNSLFRASIEYFLQTFTTELAAQKRWMATHQLRDDRVTVAEKFDMLVISRFYKLPMLRMFVRMLDREIEDGRSHPILLQSLKTVDAEFHAQANKLIEDLQGYQVIPIPSLVRIQLGSIFLAAQYIRTQT